jgi:uncharacterized protein
MTTIIADSLKDYGVDEFNGRCHDLLGTRCDPYVNQLITGESFDFHCHSNICRAILKHGLTEFDVHDVLNVFQVTGLDLDGRYFMRKSPAVPGSYIEFFAEMDLLCALSTCPGGDLSAWDWSHGEKVDMASTCRPISVQVWKLDDKLLEERDGLLRPQYTGVHGLKCLEDDA